MKEQPNLCMTCELAESPVTHTPIMPGDKIKVVAGKCTYHPGKTMKPIHTVSNPETNNVIECNIYSERK